MIRQSSFISQTRREFLGRLVNLSEISRDFEHDTNALRQASEIRTPGADICVHLSAHSPRVRDVIIGADLDEARAVMQVSIHKSRDLQVRDESIYPIGAKECRVARQRFLLIERVTADIPKPSRDKRCAVLPQAGMEPVVPI